MDDNEMVLWRDDDAITMIRWYDASGTQPTVGYFSDTRNKSSSARIPL
jgi:hypothetical protein